MRRPNILDVVAAVSEVAPSYPRVTVWWYAPEPELPVTGGEKGRARLEIVVETAASAPSDLEVMASDIADRLDWEEVSVRAHRGGGEDKRLFRLLTNR